MAITDKNDMDQTKAAADKKTAPPQPTKWDFNQVQMFGAPIPSGLYNEYYTKIKEGLLEIYKHANPSMEITLIDLDTVANPTMAYSSIVVAIRDKTIAECMAYHILVLEATGERLTPTYENINGQQVEIPRYTSNALDDVLRFVVDEKIAKAFPTVQNRLYAEGTVVPADFNPDNKQAMHKLALNTGLACTTEVSQQRQNYRDLNLAEVPRDHNLFINIDFAKQQVEDIIGNIMRSDVNVNFGTRRMQQQNKSVNSGERESNIASSTGFIDLVWAPMNPQGGFNPFAQQHQQPNQTQKYAARLVITSLVSNFGYTPAMILLALATASAVRDNNNWINTFRPSPADAGGLDLRDIGALNIEANMSNDISGFGTRIDTKSEAFQLPDLGQLISMLIRPGLIVSLDCPLGGPQSWYLSMFAAAARGNPVAIETVYNAALQLTNGIFAKYVQRGMLLTDDPGNTVHTGYWIDRKGNKRDIRDIDTLAVCNIAGERNPELIRAYSDTFLRKDIPLPKRLADRKKIIQALTNESAVFTGYAERVTFTSAFINGLVASIAETGLIVRAQSQVTDDINNQRGYADFVNNTLLQTSNSFMTYNTYQSVAQPHMMYQGSRW